MSAGVLWLIAAAWLATALLLGLIIGAVVRRADRDAATDRMWLDDQPVDGLSQVEIDRRAARLDAYL